MHIMACLGLQHSSKCLKVVSPDGSSPKLEVDSPVIKVDSPVVNNTARRKKNITEVKLKKKKYERQVEKPKLANGI